MEGFKIGGKSITMPSGWQDVKYDKALEIIDGELDQVDTLAVLTGLTSKELRSATDAESIYYFVNAFEFMQRLPESVHNFPRSIRLGVDLILFPFINYFDKFDLGKADVGQVEDMIHIIREMSKEFIGDDERTELNEGELIKICPYLVAIYIDKHLEGSYDGARATSGLTDRVKAELSFKEVIGIGYFFLNRLSHFMNGSRKELSRYRTTQKRLKLALQSWLTRLGFTPR